MGGDDSDEKQARTLIPRYTCALKLWVRVTGGAEEDSKVGPDVTGKSESEERDGNSRLHAPIRNGKCVCVESDIEVMERGM